MVPVLASAHGPSTGARDWASLAGIFGAVAVVALLVGFVLARRDSPASFNYYRAARRISLLATAIGIFSIFSLYKGYQTYGLNTQNPANDESVPLLATALASVIAVSVAIFTLTQKSLTRRWRPTACPPGDES